MTSGFLGFAFRRVLAAVPTLFGVTLIVFFMVRMMPGDPARVLAGLLASQEEVDRIRVQIGLTQPLPVQYGIFLSHLLHGDLGRSIVTQAPVAAEIAHRLPPTATLAAVATILAATIGALSGIVVSTRQYSATDYLVTVLALAGEHPRLLARPHADARVCGRSPSRPRGRQHRAGQPHPAVDHPCQRSAWRSSSE